MKWQPLVTGCFRQHTSTASGSHSSTTTTSRTTSAAIICLVSLSHTVQHCSKSIFHCDGSISGTAVVTINFTLFTWVLVLPVVMTLWSSTDYELVTLVLLIHTHSPVMTNQLVTPLTVYHILLEYPDLQLILQKYFSVNSLKELFESVDNCFLIDFIKESNFYISL